MLSESPAARLAGRKARSHGYLGEGADVAAACRELQIAEQTYYRWRNQLGGLKADDARRLKDLERENATLKRLLADAELEKAALKEIARETRPSADYARMVQLRKSRWMGAQIIQLRGGRSESSRRHPVTRRADATVSLPWPHR